MADFGNAENMIRQINFLRKQADIMMKAGQFDKANTFIKHAEALENKYPQFLKRLASYKRHF